LAVKIRLARFGAKKRPYYKIVVADARMPRDGRHIEVVGNYNPLTEPSTIEVKNDKVISWLAKGAKPTGAVEKLLRISGAMQEFEANKEKYVREA